MDIGLHRQADVVQVVCSPGVHLAGWAKRGPTGFLGTNETCVQEETVASLLDHADAGLPGRRCRYAAAR